MLSNRAKLLLILSARLAIAESSLEGVASLGPKDFIDCAVETIEHNLDVLANIQNNRSEAESFIAAILGLNG